MPPQNAARCCRAVHQQLKNRSDGIWISDRVLAAEFERYLEASRPKRRMASSVPGPLESRRRLGKRNMTELGVYAESSLPIWALPNAPDLSRWKWEPPTDAASRSERLATRQVLETPLRTYLPKWLAQWAENEAEVAVDGPSEQITADATIELTPAGQQAAQSFIADVAGWRAACVPAPVDRLLAQFEELCAKFEQHMTLATLPATEATAALDSLLQGLRTRFTKSGSVAVEEHSHRLFSSVLAGIQSCTIFRAEDLKFAFWRGFLMHAASNLSVGDKLCDILEKTFSTIPPNLINQMAKVVVTILGRPMMYDGPGARVGTDTTACGVTHTPRGGTETQLLDLEQCRALARALRVVNPRQHSQLFNNITSTIARRDVPSLRRWLFVLASMPQINRNYLLSVLKKCHRSRSGIGISNRELCCMLLAHWSSRSSQHAATDSSLNAQRIAGTADEQGVQDVQVLAAFATAELERTSPEDVAQRLGTFWLYLRGVGRDAQLLESLEHMATTHGELPYRLMKQLAVAANDMSTAVSLHALYNQTRKPAAPIWSPPFWNRHAKQLGSALDSTLSADQVYHALDIRMYSPSYRLTGENRKRQRRWVGGDTVALVEKLAARLAFASDLSDRDAFRRVTRCWRFLVAHGCASSRAVNGALFHVLTKSLAAGLSGNTARLHWFLCNLRQHHSQEVVAECEAAFKSWREKNARLFRERLKEEKGKQDLY